MFFSGNSTYPIGLDISDTSLKLLQLKKVRDNVSIQAIGKIDLKEGLFNAGEIVKKDEIVNAIKNLLEKPLCGKVSSNEVVACLPETKTFLKLIEVDLSPNNLETVIEAEIEKHVPMNIDEIYYDWEIISKARNKLFILIGAAPKHIVDHYSSLLTEAGLSVMALEIEPIAICRSLLSEENPEQKNNFDKNYAIIDFGAARTSLTLYSKNTIVFTESMPFSGAEITKEISRALEIDTDQAEKAKLICGLDETKAQGVVKDILANVVSDLTKTINGAIAFYNHHYSDRGPIDRILLCGGGANIKNLSTVLFETTKIKTSMGDATVHLSKAKEDILSARGGSASGGKTKSKCGLEMDLNSTYATAIGLALRNLFLGE